MVDRRQILTSAAVGGAGLVIAGVTLPGLIFPTRTSAPRGAGEYEALKIPPLLSGERKAGVREFTLRLQKGVSQFRKGQDTPTIGINGAYLGPTLELNAGETVRLNVTNQLDEVATLHWHGFNVPASADGGPHQPIAPGETWSPIFEVKERASLFWYHSHAHRRAGPQVYHGLAGAIYVRDEETERLDLPNDYGEDDIPLIVQDRAFNDDGSFAYSTSMMNVMMGMTGDTLLVNGGLAPAAFDARSNRLRLRLLNASNARFYRFSFADGRSFHQIGSDGGLLAQPYQTAHIDLAPAERAQIVVDLSDGAAADFIAEPASQGMMGGGGMMGDGGMMGGGGMMERRENRTSGKFHVLQIRPDANRRRSPALPRKLVQLSQPDPAAAVRTRRFVLNMGMMRRDGFTINGKSMDMNRIDERVQIGVPEIWEIENASMMAHPFHVHNVQFRILDRDGRTPEAGERGLKDVAVVAPRERVRLMLRFDGYADPDLPYMYHCHILEHEDAGMMGQFVVTA